MKVVWTETAVAQLHEIEDFIAADNSAAAEALVEKLVALGESLSSHPQRGRLVPELPGSDLRELLHGNYRLVYRTGKRIEVLTIFEGHRRLRHSDLG